MGDSLSMTEKDMSDFSDEDIINEYRKRMGKRFDDTPELKQVKDHMAEMYPNLKHISIVDRHELFPMSCDFVMYGPKMSYAFNLPKVSITRLPNLDIHYTLEKATAMIVRATLKAGIDNYMAMDKEYSKRSFLVSSEVPEGKIFLHPETFIKIRDHINPFDSFWSEFFAL